MNFMNFVYGGALVGVLASCWGHIKAFAWRFCLLFIKRIEINNHQLAEMVLCYLIDNYKRSFLYDMNCGVFNDVIREKGRVGNVVFEQLGNKSLVFWNKIIPFIWEGEKRETKPGATSSTTSSYGTLTALRGTIDFEKLLIDAVNIRNRTIWDEEKELKHKRFFIKYIPSIEKEEDKSKVSGHSTKYYYKWSNYRWMNYKYDELGKAFNVDKPNLERLIFPKHVKNLIEEIKIWRSNRDWYNEHGIPWKRGWLLYGPPGTGKTALARAFAEDLDLPVFAFNLAEIGNHELIRNWIDMRNYVPCIALIEDIDNVFHGRNNISFGHRSMFSMMMGPKKENPKTSDVPSSLDKGKTEKEEDIGFGTLNFDVFLNCLDGINAIDGIFTIITTNDISKIDDALGRPRRMADGTTEFISTRPGRIDKAIELTYMEPENKKILASRILSEYPEGMEQVLQYLDLQETPAQFQERCSQVALQHFWEICKQKEAELLKSQLPVSIYEKSEILEEVVA